MPRPTLLPSSRSWVSLASERMNSLPAGPPWRHAQTPQALSAIRFLARPRRVLSLQPGPAIFQLTQDLPEQPAVHPAWHASARPGRERIRFGVFQVVSHLVEKRVEKFFQRANTLLAVPGIDANQPARFVIPSENPHRGPVIDIQVVISPAPVDFFEAKPEQRAQCRDRGCEHAPSEPGVSAAAEPPGRAEDPFPRRQVRFAAPGPRCRVSRVEGVSSSTGRIRPWLVPGMQEKEPCRATSVRAAGSRKTQLE